MAKFKVTVYMEVESKTLVDVAKQLNAALDILDEKHPEWNLSIGIFEEEK